MLGIPVAIVHLNSPIWKIKFHDIKVEKLNLLNFSHL